MFEHSSSDSVVLYAVNGLHNGSSNWLDELLPAFKHDTGLSVTYVEDHSRAIVQRLKDEGPQSPADVLITLPPFIHMAANDGLLQPFRPAAAESLGVRDLDPTWRYCALLKNFPNLICNRLLAQLPASFHDFLAPELAGKIQYSRPGWSGAGTSFLLQILHAFGGKAGGFEYWRALQSNCIEPSAHTQGLAEQVHKGTLLAANGDVQTNLPQLPENPNVEIVFPAAPDGERYAFEYCYYIALTKAAPNAENAKKLIEFLLSHAAQSQISRLAYGLPARGDVPSDDPNSRLLSALLDGVQIWEPDWHKIARTLDEDVADFERTVLKS